MTITKLLTALDIVAAIACAAYLAYDVIRTRRAQNALIEQQQLLLDAQSERIALLEQREQMLTVAIEQQHERITTLTNQNGDLEDRNAMLERVQRKNLHASIVALPTLDVNQALRLVRSEISLN